MRVIYHIGAHNTDEDRLVRCLLKNKGKLAAEGIIVPGTGRYRPFLRDTMNSLQGATPTREAQDVILDALMDEEEAKRIVLSSESFLSPAEKVFSTGRFYPNAGDRVAAMANLFPQSQSAFFLGIRNPATILPELFARLKGLSYDDFVAGSDLTKLCWSETIRRIRAAVPDSPLTVWSNEDTPLIFPEIIAALSGHSPGMALGGLYDLVSEIMSPDGAKRLRAYLSSRPPQTVMQRRRVTSAFLDKFGLADQIEQELDLPGWTTDFVETLTDLYEEDIDLIQRIPGVTFIAA